MTATLDTAYKRYIFRRVTTWSHDHSSKRSSRAPAIGNDLARDLLAESAAAPELVGPLTLCVTESYERNQHQRALSCMDSRKRMLPNLSDNHAQGRYLTM